MGYRFKTRLWIQIALINFSIVALAGVVLRYKINFPLPWINHKHLLYAHSHFAFDAWVALALMALIVNYLQEASPFTHFKKYKVILIANCLVAYGNFIAFVLQGYAFYSILLSTLSIIISYSFIIYLWRDLNKIENTSYPIKWFKAALILLGISSLGAFSLAYLMANHIMIQDYYFGAVYFFLHFQYNGWFLFASFGLLFSYLQPNQFLSSVVTGNKLLNVMAITVAPTYLLSILWLELPEILYWVADVSAILQLLVVFYFIRLIRPIRKTLFPRISLTTRYLWMMASVAFILKIILQLLSTVPYLSHFAFGFRPIVIGYLHLSFVGITSFFILGCMNEALLKGRYSAVNKKGLLLFVAAFLVQEVVLMLQGLEAMEIAPLPYANVILFGCAVTMLIGLIWIVIPIVKKKTMLVSRLPPPENRYHSLI